jgi:hypothetical protein
MLITALQDCLSSEKLAQGRACALILFACTALQRRSRVFPIQFGNKTGANLGWANRLAFVRICAIAESFRIHYGDHSQHAALSFRVTLRQER